MIHSKLYSNDYFVYILLLLLIFLLLFYKLQFKYNKLIINTCSDISEEINNFYYNIIYILYIYRNRKNRIENHSNTNYIYANIYKLYVQIIYKLYVQLYVQIISSQNVCGTIFAFFSYIIYKAQFYDRKVVIIGFRDFLLTSS